MRGWRDTKSCPPPAFDEGLAHERLGLLCRIADHRIVHWNVPPAEHARTFLGDDPLECRLAAGPGRCVGGSVDHAEAVTALFGQRDAECGRDLAQKLVRHLHKNARAVAGVRFAANGSAMVEIYEDRQRLLDDLVRLFPLHVNHKPDATRVVFKLRIVEALFFW
jgi:hypothetical protein